MSTSAAAGSGGPTFLGKKFRGSATNLPCTARPYLRPILARLRWEYQGATRNMEANAVDPIRPGAPNFVALRHEIRCRS